MRRASVGRQRCTPRLSGLAVRPSDTGALGEIDARSEATIPVDRLDVTATNIATATIDAARAKLDCHATPHLDTDGPVTITIAACDRTIQAGAGTSTWEL